MSCDEATGAAAAQTPVVVNIKDECAYSEFYGNKNQYRAGATSACCIMGLEVSMLGPLYAKTIEKCNGLV